MRRMRPRFGRAFRRRISLGGSHGGGSLTGGDQPPGIGSQGARAGARALSGTRPPRRPRPRARCHRQSGHGGSIRCHEPPQLQSSGAEANAPRLKPARRASDATASILCVFHSRYAERTSSVASSTSPAAVRDTGGQPFAQRTAHRRRPALSPHRQDPQALHRTPRRSAGSGAGRSGEVAPGGLGVARAVLGCPSDQVVERGASRP